MSGYLNYSAYTTMKIGGNLDSIEQADGAVASPDEVRLAIEALSPEDFARIRKAAKYCRFGTEYQDPQELVNEAILRTMRGAVEENEGRHWPKSVPFVVFMVKTIESIANGSRDSSNQTNTVHLETFATETSSVDDALGHFGFSNISVCEQAIDVEETEDRVARATADSNLIDCYFASDPDIQWIIMGYKDELKASEIREISGMTLKQYETAHRRFRRGLDKLYPARRT